MLFKLLFVGLLSNVYSNDVIFMVDSSKSIFGSESCDYSQLIQNFTSDFVSELSDADNINYASVQYNSKGYIDFSFNGNNSDVYDKMKNYDFIYGAPTLIHRGLDKVTELFGDYDTSTESMIHLVLITDGETLNKLDFQNSLTQYPFNSTEFKLILIKIGSHIMENTIVLDVFNNTEINNLTCSNNPLEHIFNNTNFYTSTTTLSSSTTTTLTPSSTTPPSTTPSSTTPPSTTPPSTTPSSTTPSSTTTLTTTSTTKTNSSIPLYLNSSSTTPTTYTNSPNNSYVFNSIYKILIIVIACIIFLFSIIACICICCYKTNKKIRPTIYTETGNNAEVIHVNTVPIFGRSLRNEIYNSVSFNNGEYIEVDDSLDDGDNVENSYNYLRKTNETKSTDF